MFQYFVKSCNPNKMLHKLCHKKRNFKAYAESKDSDQPVKPHSLIMGLVFFVFLGFYIIFQQSFILQWCLDVTGSSMLTFRVLPHWNMPQIHDIPPSHIIPTSGWPVLIPNSTLLMLSLFVLRFYGPVNPMGSCWAWSVYLTTHLLGRLSPLSG